MGRSRGLSTVATAYDGGSLSYRNLVINGAMQIDQRDATTTALGYTLDRFYLFRSSNHDQLAFSVIQDTDAPNGFSNSLKYTTTTAETTVDSDELLYLRQRIEAQNLQQLAYGTSSAKSVTLSFWVKSSITGTFAVSLYQDDASKQLSKTYTINSANTWEKKTITYIGNTADVINNDNGNGLQINWILDAGSDYTSTDSSSAWVAYGTGGGFAYGQATNAVATTLNATWYITGVQLEVGDAATDFEHRPYGLELSLCQRYYQICRAYGGTRQLVGLGYGYDADDIFGLYHLTVPLRSNSPTMSYDGVCMFLASTVDTNTIAFGLNQLPSVNHTVITINVDNTGSPAIGGRDCIAYGFTGGTTTNYIDVDAEL